MRIRGIFAAVLTSGVVAVAPAVAPAAPARTLPVATASKTCGAGYTHAVIGGAQKCLRRGEFCSTAYRRQYPRYGYRCVAGRLR